MIKEDIRIYDFDFNLIYIISDWISVNWELYYNKTGTFELHIPPSSGIAKVLEKNLFLTVIQGDKQAIITGKMITDDIAVYGRTPNWILGKRIITPFSITNSTSCESIIRSKLSEVFDSNDNFTLAESAGGFAELDGYKLEKAKDALTFISENLSKEYAGHKVTFKPAEHSWEFKIYRGTEKNIIISEKNKNAHQPKYTQDILDMSNGLYYKDEETGEYESIPSDKKGIYRWYSLGTSQSLEEATEELEKMKINTSLSFDTTEILYGKDYGLGDCMYVETDFGGNKVRKKQMITGVRIWDEQLNRGQSPIFEDKEESTDVNNP